MTNVPPEKCSSRIKRALYIRGMKQSELCEITKIPKSAMSEYISGAYEPKQDRVFLISKALGVDPVWLMGFNVPMEPQKMSPDEPALTGGEMLMLQLFRQIPEDKQPEALELLQVALKMQKKP